MKPPRALGVIAGTFCVSVTLIAAQEAPEFEFVSLRRSPPAATGEPSDPASMAQSSSQALRASFLVLPDGRFEARRQTLATLASVAFGFDQIDSKMGVVDPAAGWMATESFDVIAAAGRTWTTPPPGTKVPTELRTMLRTMLEDRFALQARIGTKKMSVVALRLAKPGTLGPAVRPSSAECRRAASTDSSSAASASPRCPPPDITLGIQATAVTMVELADILSKEGSFRTLGPFVDRTGLTGLYDVSLSFKTWLPKRKWTVDELRGLLSEQLGVKMERTSLPFPALLIEKAKKPYED